MSKKDATESLETLRRLLPKGTRVWAVKRHSTTNGTTWIDFYTFSAERT